MSEKYNDYQQWQHNPEQFWQTQSHQLDWFKAPNNVVSQHSNGSAAWFADGELNTSYLALDVHVKQGRGEQLALIYDSPVTGQKKQFTYAELLAETERVAGMLHDLGVEKGDTVIIYMPMIPEAAMAMLACARIGAIHSVVFGGFAAPELASRIDDAKPKVILAASCGIEVSRIIEYKPMIDEAILLAQHKPQCSVILARPECAVSLNGHTEFDWADLTRVAEPKTAVSLNGDDPLYILYTSGTTGKPKGVVRDNAGHAVALKYCMDAVYGMQAGDVFWSASDVGWVVGHSFIVYGPLIHGCTTIMYEGKPVMTPDAGAFWRVIADYKVNALFTAPTAFRAVRREDPNADLLAQYDISSLRFLFTAGERLDPTTQQWLTEKLEVPVIDNWWQTETGWPIASNTMGREVLPIKMGAATKPIAGYEVHILDEHGNQVANGVQGNIAIKLPLPPGCLTTVWNDHERFINAYLSDYDGYYTSGDGGYYDEEGYLFVMGRVDDVINVAGHRLSTGALEEVIAANAAVAECAVVAEHCDIKGEIPVGFVVLNSGRIDIDNVPIQLISDVRKNIGPLACYKDSYIVARLPKTRSGKVLRKVLKAMLHGEEVAVPPTIDDPASLDEIRSLLSLR